MLVRPSPLRHVLAHGFLHPGSSPSSPILVGRSFASSSLRLTEVEVYHAPQSTSSHAFTQLQRTPLYVFHLSNRAKMVPFAGWSMPLSYGDTGQSASPCHSSPTLLRPGPKLTPPVVAHNHVRTSAGLFDVSHMLQHRFAGPSAQGFLMSLCPSSLNALAPFSSTLSVLLNEEGGIIDDTIITKQESDESFYVVTNAGRASEDKAFIGKKLEEWSARVEGEVKWETLDRWGLLALQGPKAGEALQSLTSGNLAGIRFGQSGFVEIGKEGVRCHVARGGYTGEDGFEVVSPPSRTPQPARRS
jgi:aminomethyltransferase